MVEFVAYSVTVHTESSLMSLWTRELRERDLEEELFELNLKSRKSNLGGRRIKKKTVLYSV